MEWQEAHEGLIRIARNRAELEHALGKALLRALRAEVWRALAMGTFGEYAERTLGLNPRQTEERLRVARALEGLPVLEAALAQAKVHFCARAHAGGGAPDRGGVVGGGGGKVSRRDRADGLGAPEGGRAWGSEG